MVNKRIHVFCLLPALMLCATSAHAFDWTRQRAGHSDRDNSPEYETAPTDNPGAIAPPGPNLSRESVPIPDRWRLLDSIGIRAAPAQQRAAESDRKAQHLEAELAGHDEMTVLVDRDQHADRDDKRQDTPQKIKH